MIHAKFEWVDPSRSSGASPGAGAGLAWGTGILMVGDIPIWFSGPRDDPKPVTWSWIELLEWLSANWLPILSEQTYPGDLSPAEPQDLRDSMEKYLTDRRSLQDREADALDEAVFHFEERHDMARALRGIDVPSLLLVREGNNMVIHPETMAPIHANLSDVRDALGRLGDEVASRLSPANSNPRARHALDAWKVRNTVTNVAKLIRLATDMLPKEHSANLPANDLEFWELAAEPGADSELTAAARLSRGGRVSSEDTERILRAVRETPKVDTSKLDDLAEEMTAILGQSSTTLPYEQGYALASRLSGILNLKDFVRVDPERILVDLGVAVREISVSQNIDAIGCWGPNHGPTVLINRSGRRSHVQWGRRATLAHELCHLLVDRRGALPLAEVLGGRSPKRLEQRANAFAAGFLLPQFVANHFYRENQTVERTIPILCKEFGVGKVLAANQLRLLPQLTKTEHAILNDISQADANDW